MIAIVDYGVGNLRSVQKGFEKAGYRAVITDDPSQIRGARAVVLPGVGAFADAMANLRRSGLLEVVKEAAQDKPFLGICLGLQLMFEASEEGGWHEGLGIFPGKVVRLPAGVKVPHMGWNQIHIKKPSPILKGIPDGSYFYFVHSYYVFPTTSDYVVTTTDYGLEFTSVVGRGNVFGIQFHPEKSSQLGLKILKNFGELMEEC
ncbi:imidazole glycerol phosphate synthase subunit HisH [Calderihabitans maritimus]|uniref:Imidazole glycerol phosphate synthase subunit HisH n=1 Tax=Calderihabitans maritimus TaxID=1246530 RepID=A0A1Z5HPU4_9FIRM|nr:imidazole glycerol phosphate synthase subunit HisH [Calderihabitans maritimus]GAW91552.1 imidazole glycerol phosphate synthase subunit HisH [Calderihabitans maritimus]